jgi:hypothetical protein
VGDTDTGLFFPDDDTVGISTAGTEIVRVTASGIGVGVTTPTALVHTSGATGAHWDRVIDNAGGANARGRKARGTSGTPTAVQSGDTLLTLSTSGYDGTDYVDAVQIRGEVDAAVSTGVVPGRFRISLRSAAGVLNERLRIDNGGLITGTGTSLGAWTSYTPTLGGTGWALGNGTVTAAYAELGKIIAFRVRIVFGSTSTFGAAAALTLTAPASSRNAGAAYSLACRLFDASLSESWNALASLAINSTTMTIRSWNGDNKAADTSSTVPFTWATSDEVVIHGVYERS